MTKSEIVSKNLALSADFNSFISTRPDMMKKIPNNAFVIFEVKSDKKLSDFNREIVRSKPKKNIFVACKSGKGWQIDSFKSRFGVAI
ncbi:MAG TPA: DUF5647 family protein [Candidatus Paceibacterota bacterium]|nr:DUF5647 family protein [Candidatus Paceibacterota bacterium]